MVRSLDGQQQSAALRSLSRGNDVPDRCDGGPVYGLDACRGPPVASQPGGAACAGLGHDALLRGSQRRRRRVDAERPDPSGRRNPGRSRRLHAQHAKIIAGSVLARARQGRGLLRQRRRRTGRMSRLCSPYYSAFFEELQRRGPGSLPALRPGSTRTRRSRKSSLGRIPRSSSWTCNTTPRRRRRARHRLRRPRIRSWSTLQLVRSARAR